MSTLREIASSRELFVNLTLRELRGKYKRSVLGWAWSLLNPLSSMLIYTLIFSVIFKQKIAPGDPSGLEVFPLFLLCALLPWNYLANSLGSGMESLVANANLVKKVYFPREVVVAAIVASWLVSFFMELAVLSAALLIAGNMVLPWLPMVLVTVTLESGFVLGMALLLAICNVYFRDVRHLVGIALQIWFYLTPIIYPITLVPEKKNGWPLRTLFLLNPMARFARIFRNLLYDLRWPSFGDMAYVAAVAAAAMLIGMWAFRKLEPRLAEEL
jgi:ABC-2 type transport system permease protein